MCEKIPKSYTITTERFKLRMTNTEDVPRIYSATKHSGFNDGMTWDPPKNSEEIMDSIHRDINAWEMEDGYAFSIFKKDSAKLLGRISIRKTKQLNVLNIGFWTHPEVQRTGLMTESVAGILNFGFEKLRATSIEASYVVWNKASEKVLKRNGLEFKRYIKKGIKKNGKWTEVNLLSLSKKKWKIFDRKWYRNQ